MSNIFSNLRWGILPLVLVTTTATRIMATGSPEAILAGVGYAGLRCIMGR